MTDIHQQLSTLLGYPVKRIRVTEEVPRRISVIDLLTAITRKDGNHAAEDLGFVKKKYPDVTENFGDFKFRGQGQRKTPVTDVRGAVELILVLPGAHASQILKQAAELLVKYLGGDLAIIDEICVLRGFQEQLAARAPDDPRCIFGGAVETSSSTNAQTARALSTMNQRLTAQEQALNAIREQLKNNRQRVNLNVRAPRRAVPYQAQISTDISTAGRPFPITRFLDLKERDHPSWESVRRSFAPSFGIFAQILKKKKLREQGKAAIYVEQNHRPQLLYTVEDRELMEEAWAMTAAHRDDLTGPGR